MEHHSLCIYICSVFSEVKKPLFCFYRLGCDVRLLLHGALHGKLPHHAGGSLPEIHEQPGQVQELISLEPGTGQTHQKSSSWNRNEQSYCGSNVLFRALHPCRPCWLFTCSASSVGVLLILYLCQWWSKRSVVGRTDLKHCELVSVRSAATRTCYWKLFAWF